MQVKIFEADDMKTALQQVKEALGPDALILSTRTVRRGGLGLGKSRLEVTAAVEAREPKKDPVPAPAPPASAFSSAVADDISYADIWKKRRVIDPLEEELEGIKGQLTSLNLDSLRKEISELKKMVRGVASEPPAPQAPVFAPAPAPQAVSSRLTEGAAGREGGWMTTLADGLASRGLEEAVIEEIMQSAMLRLTPEQKKSAAALKAFCFQMVSHMVKTCDPRQLSKGRQRRVALIGPTGVGKTTTVAKLAADHMIKYGPKVALVTIDIYRIAAAEQLKVYGEIMNLPVEVVISPDQLKDVFARHRDKDLILIDTAGRSPKDQQGLQELASFLGAEHGIENHIVLSATTRESELSSVLRRFSLLPLHAAIFTKLDECETIGSILNTQQKYSFPISYLTNGQRVPEDLLPADSKQIASLILGSK